MVASNHARIHHTTPFKIGSRGETKRNALTLTLRMTLMRERRPRWRPHGSSRFLARPARPRASWSRSTDHSSSWPDVVSGGELKESFTGTGNKASHHQVAWQKVNVISLLSLQAPSPRILRASLTNSPSCLCGITPSSQLKALTQPTHTSKSWETQTSSP